ncbi:MAG: dTDP-4-dehydrorhamnose 3,5-epimerase [Elusimicrobia bacterium]|nr:dTDP-4-dehydrorhamnose 3,5-epimerase [Elusimicrobiota bacterium]
MSFRFSPYQLDGLLLVDGRRFPDERGAFMEAFKELDFRGAGIPTLVQDNLSRSYRGVLRGLHYQKKPAAIGKLIRCIRGRIFDVAVDIRKDSPSFGKWAAVELSDENNRMLWVPEGFAHGFYTLSDEADVLYKVTGYWSPEHERGLIWNDPQVGVRWPSGPVRLSPKDAELPPLARADNNF